MPLIAAGAGAPLVLLHGLGSSRRAWDPVIPALAEHFHVIAVDLPGFGDSGPLPAQHEPLPATLAAAVAGLLDDLGVTTAHLAGNSLGGWVALELAAIRPAASLTLLSPAALWRGNVPLYNRVSLQACRWLIRHAAGLLSGLVTYHLGRALVLSQTHGRPMQLPPEYARATITWTSSRLAPASMCCLAADTSRWPTTRTPSPPSSPNLPDTSPRPITSWGAWPGKAASWLALRLPGLG